MERLALCLGGGEERSPVGGSSAWCEICRRLGLLCAPPGVGGGGVMFLIVLAGNGDSVDCRHVWRVGLGLMRPETKACMHTWYHWTHVKCHSTWRIKIFDDEDVGRLSRSTAKAVGSMPESGVVAGSMRSYHVHAAIALGRLWRCHVMHRKGRWLSQF